ncbi:glycosyltransferase [Sphingomonas sp. ST-64]|uniref:Glycosyltransferase n=1 Tax=Sphingomonas plantiphila TaxID=3163295 RepID=A0ABW8YI92_9SPHN
MSVAAPTGRLCLATVSTDDFLPGTIVAIGSFLDTNRWFSGDIVIFHDADLSAGSIRTLSQIWPDLQFRRIPQDLADAIATLVHAVPRLAGRRARFHSLATLALEDYAQVLFCDSDVLFQASILPMFAASPGDVVAVGDAGFLRGLAWDRTSFAEVPPDAEGALYPTFNAGLMLFGSTALDGRAYRQALAMLAPERWAGIVASHTDQLVLNRIFEHRVSLMSWRFNFLLFYADLIAHKEPMPFDAIAVLHFNGSPKPWTASRTGLVRNPLMFQAIAGWRARARTLLPDSISTPWMTAKR